MEHAPHTVGMWLFSIGSVVALVVVVTAIQVSRPSPKLAINEGCEVDGVTENLRLFFAPATFWRTQLKHLDKTIADLKKAPASMIAINAMVAEAERKTQAMLDDMSAKHPSLRPSDASEAAAALRKQADQIEADEANQILFESLQRRADALSVCRAGVVAMSRRYGAE